MWVDTFPSSLIIIWTISDPLFHCVAMNPQSLFATVGCEPNYMYCIKNITILMYVHACFCRWPKIFKFTDLIETCLIHSVQETSQTVLPSNTFLSLSPFFPSFFKAISPCQSAGVLLKRFPLICPWRLDMNSKALILLLTDSHIE